MRLWLSKRKCLQLAWKHPKVDANAPNNNNQDENRHDCGHPHYPPVNHPDVSNRHNYPFIAPYFYSLNLFFVRRSALAQSGRCKKNNEIKDEERLNGTCYLLIVWWNITRLECYYEPVVLARRRCSYIRWRLVAHSVILVYIIYVTIFGFGSTCHGPPY